MKNVNKILFTGLLLSFCLTTVALDDSSKSTSEFEKSSFKKTSSGPSFVPETGGAGSGGGGNPIPVSGAFIVIAIGSAIFLSKKIRDDIKK